MSAVGRCLQDGFSTGGTAGPGFGAIRRLSTEFDGSSIQPLGTVIVARVLAWPGREAAFAGSSAVCVPMANETFCGDNWSIAEKEGTFSMIVADGLGHGPLAAKASDEAVRVFDADPFREPGRNSGIGARGTPLDAGPRLPWCGGDIDRRQIKYAGVGNISGCLLSGSESRGLFSHTGTVGLQFHRIQEFDYPWPEKSTLVMHSDGLKSRWDMEAYPGLLQRHPAVIAGTLYRDFSRGRDDMTVAVVR